MSPFISAPVAVMIPETTVPPLILPLKLPVTLPTNVLAVIIPEALILPTELMPTPVSPPSTLLPTCKVDWGFVVAIPTVPPVL